MLESRLAVERASRLGWICAFGALLLFLVLAVWFSFTRGPWWDEGLFADVAINFRNSGHLRSSVLAPYSFDNMPAVDRYMYWQLPGYLISLGAWFRLAPVSVQWMRLFSVLWGCVFAGAWFLFVRSVSRNETLALLVASVVVLDYSCVAAASDGRMDMMCAALGQAALAAYVVFRASHRNWAALLAGTFGAASLFSHPMGAIPNACLAIVLLADRRKWRSSTVALFLLPYFTAAALWLSYIMQAPQTFLAQAKNVSGYRVGGVLFVVGNIINDFQARYLQFYFAPHSGWHKLKVFSLLFGLVGLIALVATRKARAEPLTKRLMAFMFIAYLGIAVLDDLKYPYYFVYITPILSASGAIWLYKVFSDGGVSRWIGSALLAAYVMATIAGAGYYIRRNDFANEYKPVAATVRRLVKPGDVIMGASELGFSLGFGPPLIDDCSFGFTSGVQPEIIIEYPACRLPGYSTFIFDWSRKKLATEYHPVLEKGGYTVYVRNGDLPRPGKTAPD